MDELNKFCENYEVRVLNDSKRRARYHPARFFTDPMRADIIEKARAIVNGEEYDNRVQVNIELPEEDINVLMKMAHEQDITLNNLIENILKNNILNGDMQEQLELDF